MSFRSIIAKANRNNIEVYKSADNLSWRFGFNNEIMAEMFDDGQIWTSIFYPRDVWTPELIVSGKKKKVAKRCLAYTLNAWREKNDK